MHPSPTPPPAWYASGLRRIASGIARLADAVDRKSPPPSPWDDYCPARDFLLRGENGARREGATPPLPGEDLVLGARVRAQRWI